MIQRRLVRLPVRPLDLAAMFEDGEKTGEEEDTAGNTVCDCIDCKALASSPSGARLVKSIGSKPASVGLRLLPATLRQGAKPECL
jgi:hypothetical protein